MCVLCPCICACTTCMHVLVEYSRGRQIPGTGVTGRCWELKQGPPQDLLTTGLSYHLYVRNFQTKHCIWSCSNLWGLRKRKPSRNVGLVMSCGVWLGAACGRDALITALLSDSDWYAVLTVSPVLINIDSPWKKLVAPAIIKQTPALLLRKTKPFHEGSRRQGFKFSVSNFI
jgi:hypothetical protein